MAQDQQHHNPQTSAAGSQAWLDALDRSTYMLLLQGGASNEDEIQASLQYLKRLEEQLRPSNEADWYRPPARPPPPFPSSSKSTKEPKKDKASPTSTNHHFDHISNNPFASFYDPEDDSDSDDSTFNEEDPSLLQNPTNNNNDMVVRRVWMRLLSHQSDLLACLSGLYRKQRQWWPAAEAMARADHTIQPALVQADAYLAQWWDEETAAAGDHVAVTLKQQLQEDVASIVVAVQHVSQQADRFFKEAGAQQRRLQRKLQPQWESRDAIKARMGDQWYHNPHPNQSFAKQRERDEAELREIERALDHVMSGTAALQDRTDRIQSRLNNNNHNDDDRIPASSNPHENDVSTEQTQRYNGVRPVDLSRRLPLRDYPDPATLGWTFTGSAPGSSVEFFECRLDSSNLVKLDWYYTTGTVKTSLEHPVQGRTQLFLSGEHISPSVYRKILSNPREHTGQRYHTNTTTNKPKKNNNNKRGSSGKRGDRR